MFQVVIKHRKICCFVDIYVIKKIVILRLSDQEVKKSV